MKQARVETFKEFTFEAAHRSPPFEGLHGHSFKVQIVLQGEPHPQFGWSHNLYEVDQQIKDVRITLDHSYLNDIEGLAFPTLENVTKWLFHKLSDRLHGLVRVTLSRGRDGDAEGCTYSAHG